MTGDATPISDEAVKAFADAAATYMFERGILNPEDVRDGLRAARPLLVSAEAERRGDSDELLAAAAHESSEDRRLAALMVEPRNRAVLERRAEVTERLAAEVEGLRAELADSQFKFEQMRRERDTADAIAANWKVRVTELNAAVAALRAAGGQEKPDRCEWCNHAAHFPAACTKDAAPLHPGYECNCCGDGDMRPDVLAALARGLGKPSDCGGCTSALCMFPMRTVEVRPTDAEDVACGVCRAAVGEPCRVLLDPRYTRNPHAARRAAAAGLPFDPEGAQ